MPVLEPSRMPLPLGTLWSHADVVTWLRSQLRQYDSSEIQTHTIRQHVNLAIGQVAELLAASDTGFYDWFFQSEIEDQLLNDWVPYVALDQPVALPALLEPYRYFPTVKGGQSNMFYPQGVIAEVKSVTALRQNRDVLLDFVLLGPLTKISMETLLAVHSQENDQWSQSMAWVHKGPHILLFFGKRVAEVTTGSLPDDKDYLRPVRLLLEVRRNPILDDLRHPESVFSEWNLAVDLPDRHIRLAMLLAEKSLMGLLGRQDMTGSGSQEILALMQQITGNMFTIEQTRETPQDATPTQRT